MIVFSNTTQFFTLKNLSSLLTIFAVHLGKKKKRKKEMSNSNIETLGFVTEEANLTLAGFRSLNATQSPNISVPHFIQIK